MILLNKKVFQNIEDPQDNEERYSRYLKGKYAVLEVIEDGVIKEKIWFEWK